MVLQYCLTRTLRRWRPRRRSNSAARARCDENASQYSRDDWELLEERLLFSGVPLVDVYAPSDAETSLSDATDSEFLLETSVAPTTPMLFLEPQAQSHSAYDVLSTQDGVANTLSSTWSPPGMEEWSIDMAGLEPTSSSDTNAGLEVVFVGADIENHDQLIEEIQHQADRPVAVFVLDSDRDGVEQITSVLAHFTDVEAIHLVTHGSDGQIVLGNISLTESSLAQYHEHFASWNASLAHGADLLIYGCDVASTGTGEALVSALGQLVGSDVAASADVTGHASLGGDWEFEYINGAIDTGTLFEPHMPSAWVSTLASMTFQNGDANGYSGTSDTYVEEASPFVVHANSTDLIASDAASDVNQILIRFDNIIGLGPNQIPVGATITHASLTLQVTGPDGGTTLDIHQMILPWAGGSNWFLLLGGVNMGADAIATPADSASAGASTIVFDVTSSLQNWLGGALSQGWVITSDSSSDVSIASSEAATQLDRPLLSVTYSVGPNQAEVLENNLPLTVGEGGTAVIDSSLLATSDDDNVPSQLQYTVTSPASSGQLELTTNPGVAILSFTQDDIDSGRLVYVHDGSESVSDAFDFEVDDGNGTSTSGTFNITVTAVNDEQSVAVNAPLSVIEGAPGSITAAFLATSDPDNAAADLQYTVTTAPASGQLELATNPGVAIASFTQDDIDSGRLVYVHDGSEGVSDAFDFEVDDGNGTSTSGTFNISVTAINDEQSLDTNNPLVVNEGASGVIGSLLLRTSDVDNLPSQLQYTVNATTVHGQLELTTNVGVAITAFTQDDVDNNRLVYVHDGTENFADSFQFTVNDGQGISDAGTFIISVTSLNDEESLDVNNPLNVIEGGAGTISSGHLAASDIEQTATQLQYTVTSGPAHGQLELTTNVGVAITSFTQDDVDSGRVIYVHGAGEVPTDSFVFAVDDGIGTRTSATFTILVQPVNDSPVAVGDVVTVNEGATFTIDIIGNDIDVDGTIDGTSIVIVTPPNLGTLTLNGDGTVDYAHDGSETTLDGFRYYVSDNSGAVSNVVAVVLNINPQNDAPVAAGDDYEATSGTMLMVKAPTLLENDSDIEGDGLRAVIVAAPQHGTVSLSSDGTFMYMPDRGFVGTDTFTYSANDGAASSAPATVTIVVNAPRNDSKSPDTPSQPTPGSSTILPDADFLNKHLSDRTDALKSAHDPEDVQHTQTHAYHGQSYQPITWSASGKATGEQVGSSATFTQPAWSLQEATQVLVRNATLPELSGFQTYASWLWHDLDQFGNQIDSDAATPVFGVGGSTALAASVSVGYMFWLIRGGQLFAMVMAQLPAWRLVDPLPILAALERDDEDDLSLQEMVDETDSETSVPEEHVANGLATDSGGDGQEHDLRPRA